MPHEAHPARPTRRVGGGSTSRRSSQVLPRRPASARRRTIDVLKGANLEVRSGELVGLVGENGSRKSTMMQIVVGLLNRDAGDVDGPERLGYCPQVPMFWEKLTVAEHFRLFAEALFHCPGWP